MTVDVAVPEVAEAAPVPLFRERSALVDRILDCMPAASYGMHTLLRLVDIVETESIPTAAVECRRSPRMLINPRFVERHAETPEKLLMLVMHELHHIILGHTRQFDRPTPAHNLVFDAVINALLCRMFPGSEYTALFTGLYSLERFPECLLRPAEGFPNACRTLGPIQGLSPEHMARVQESHRALYSDTGMSYAELFALLPSLIVESVGENGGAKVPLLGSHDEEEVDLDGLPDDLRKLLGEIVDGWPITDRVLPGRSVSGFLQHRHIHLHPPAKREALRGLFRRLSHGTRGHRRCIQAAPVETMSALPALSRRSAVLRVLGVPTLLHPGVVLDRRRVPREGLVHVYLDVSGSMGGLLEALYGAVVDCRLLVHPTVHLFSDCVHDLTLTALRRGECATTGGTSIECVARHMKAHHVGRAVLLTDGYVGPIVGEIHHILRSAKLGVALTHSNRAAVEPLLAVADHVIELPM
jgi:hypothetical protein